MAHCFIDNFQTIFMKKYKILEHTADIRIKIYGKTIKELFKNSAKALFDLIVQNKNEEDKEERKVSLEAMDLNELLINWLNELISIFYTYKFLPIKYDLDIDKNFKKLEASIKGIKFNPYKNKIDTEIKAATYCNLDIKKNKKNFEVEIVFDV